MYDPTFELTRREYKPPHPKPDTKPNEFADLLSIGCSDAEAMEILDIEFLTFDEWIGMYGIEEEVSPETDYSVFVVI